MSGCKQHFEYLILVLAVFIGSIFLRSLKKPEKKTEVIDDSDYEANY